jgi:hypothetical protein
VWDPHHFKPGKAIDFRAQFPADGQPRRLVVRWRPAPGKLSLLFTGIKQRWQKLASTKSAPVEKFFELRSGELLAENSAEYPGAAFNPMAAPDYKPSAISNATDGPEPRVDFLRSR